MTLLSLLMRPISVSCFLLFGVAPLLNPTLWAASRVGVKPVAKGGEKQAKPLSVFSEEKEHWELFKDVSTHFRSENIEETLKKASVFLLRWPHSPVSDSVRLIAASCASKLERYEQALGFCNDLQEAELKNQVLAQRLKWLYALHRYQEAYELGLKAPIETLGAERRAWSRFYVAEALYHEASENYKKNNRFYEKDLVHVEQAYSLYTVAQEIIGYMAVYGRASSAEAIGLAQIAAASYLKASKMQGADTAKCIYLAARILSDDEPTQAYALCKELIQSSKEWKAQAAFLWMQMALKTGQPEQILKHPDWVKAASEEDGFGAQYFLGSAQAESGKKQEAFSTLKELIRNCVNSSQCEIDSYAKPAVVRLANLYTAEDAPESLVELNELIGQKGGRTEEYFFVCFKAAELFDELNNKETALDQYARIVVQAPESPWIGSALLRKGLLEADKGFYAASWASLDLYLRNHAQEKGYEQAWPTFLRVSSELNEYQGTASFNHDRFKLVLDRLKAFDCSEEQKVQYLSDESERLFVEFPDKAELLLIAIQTHRPSYFTPSQELLMAMCRAKIEGHVDSFVAQAKPALMREKQDPAKLEVRFAKCLISMVKNTPSSAKHAQELAAEAFFSAFEKSPRELSREDGMWMAQWVQGQLAQKSFEGDWGKYFIDPIFDRSRVMYIPINLSESQKLWAGRAVSVLQSVFNRGQADLSARLMLARLQWATLDFKGCSQTLLALKSTILDSEDKDPALRAYLSYDCGAHLLSGDVEGALEVSRQLFDLMEKEADPSLAASLRLCLARACVQAAQKDPSKAVPMYKRALGFYERLCSQPFCELEPMFLEASIEKTMLLASMPKAKEDSEISMVTKLLAIKRQYVEADTAHTQALHNLMQTNPEAQKIWQSYVILLDALLAQYQAQEFLAATSHDEDIQAATIHLNLALNLYQTLQTEKYGLTPFLKEMSAKGRAQIESMQVE